MYMYTYNQANFIYLCVWLMSVHCICLWRKIAGHRIKVTCFILFVTVDNLSNSRSQNNCSITVYRHSNVVVRNNAKGVLKYWLKIDLKKWKVPCLRWDFRNCWYLKTIFESWLIRMKIDKIYQLFNFGNCRF